MSENILKKIIDNKKTKINNLKKDISIDLLSQKIIENSTFIDFKKKIIKKKIKFQLLQKLKKLVLLRVLLLKIIIQLI